MTRRNLVWVRLSGQAEMRENVRSAMKAARLTQRSTALQAHMPAGRVAGFLGGNTWWTLEDLTAVAAVVNAAGHEVTVQGLQGGSVFRNDPWDRLKLFHFPPTLDEQGRWRAQPVAPPEPKETWTRALCCECGRLINVSVTGGERRRSGEDEKRWVLEFDCLTCKQATMHAVLRFGEHADYAEITDQALTRAEIADEDLKALLGRLAEFNVDVHFTEIATRKKSAGKEPFVGGYEFDESKSQWRVEIDPLMPTRMQADLLADLWVRISTNEHLVDWDARQDGVITRATSKIWSAATDDLMVDIDRFLDVERRRMVQSVNDQIAEHGAARLDERSQA